MARKYNYFNINELLSHFSKEVSPSLVQYINDVAFKNSRYFFTTRIKNKQYGYCTHCKQQYETPGLRHNTEVECPNCKSKCIVKASGYGRSKMVDEAYIVYYEKSQINPKAIVARGIYAVRDYRADYRDVEAKFAQKALYLFEPGNSVAANRLTYYSYDKHENYLTSEWDICKTVYSEASKDHFSHIPNFCSKESIKEAVKGTPFSWSGWEFYGEKSTRFPWINKNDDDMVKFFDLYAKYPCVEYLTKLGFHNLVIDKLRGNRTYGAINWRGKNLFKVLKITKQELNEIRPKRLHVSFLTLKIFQTGKKDGSNLSIKEARELEITYDHCFLELEKLLPYGSVREITKYLQKQREKDPKKHYSLQSTLTTWRDYIADCIRLEMNLKDKQIVYPKNLYNAHQNTIKQVKIKADKELNEKIKKRIKELEKYKFEHEGLMIRAAASTEELIAEGEALHHCVGTYAEKYVKGKTNILLIRRTTEPDKPYYTMELQKNRVLQVRGNNNRAPDEAVKSFVEAFKDEKLNKKKMIDIPA